MREAGRTIYLGVNDAWFVALPVHEQRRNMPPTYEDWLMFVGLYVPRMFGLELH